MNKHIFVSKGTLDLGRNREQRRLEAQLDNGQESSRVHLERTNEVSVVKTHPALLFCDYLESCNKACFQGTDKYNNCMIRKFKDRYKDFDFGSQLGI